MPSVGSGTYSPGPNMRWSPGKEGSDGECRCHHWRCLSRSQKPCYSVQNALVYINTLMLQRVLSEVAWATRLTVEDLRALTPLIYAHVVRMGTSCWIC